MAHPQGNRNVPFWRQIDLRHLICIILLLVVIPLALLIIHLTENDSTAALLSETAGTVIPAAPGKPELTFFDGGWYTPKPQLDTTLVIGVDMNAERLAQHNIGNGQADFIFLLVSDCAAQTYTAIHINRDTMTDVLILTSRGAPVRTVTQQLALSHAYGGNEERSCRNTIRAVSALLKGITINHYVSLTMESIPVINDLVGGVPVVVMDDFSGFDDTLVRGETVTLMGSQAELYIRARMGMADATNLHRMERQQQYLMSFQEQFKRCADADSSFVLNTLLEISDDLDSDCTVEQLSKLIESVQGYKLNGYRSLSGEAVKGEKFIEFYPDENALRSLVMDVFYDRVDDM